MSFLLLLSVWLRAKVTFLQKYLVPAGIIAGTLRFADQLGVDRLSLAQGWVPLKVGDFGMISSICSVSGWDHRPRVLQHAPRAQHDAHQGRLWIDLLFWLFYGLQATVGYGITGST
ncbi:MAG: hypothetical protein ACLT2T_07400 [Bilophila wadsworthia]